MYFHRVLRLTPALAAGVLFYAKLMEHSGSGPLWNSRNWTEECKSNAWATLMYIHNYVGETNNKVREKNFY